MIAWARGQVGPSGYVRDVVAYSVRPDLWTPGHLVMDTRPQRTRLADWHYAGRVATLVQQSRESAHLAQPGVAEAMVVAGALIIEHVGDAWVPMEPLDQDHRLREAP